MKHANVLRALEGLCCPKRVMHLIFDMWTDRRTQAICANLIQIPMKDLRAAIKREMEKIINPGICSGFP
jgi:hypothetical protein